MDRKKEDMVGELYDLYCRAFPHYPVRKGDFADLLAVNCATLFEERRDGLLAGAALVHKNAIVFLAVDPCYRRLGIGTKLLALAEEHITRAGHDSILLGRGKHYLLQGVPLEEGAIPFFEKRGYFADWVSVNMTLDLEAFDLASLAIPRPPTNVSYRFARPEDRKDLLPAVERVNPSWVRYFTEGVSVMVACEGKKILGFAIVDKNGGRFTKEDGVGTVGCVGVIPEARKKGIGRFLVAQCLAYLKACSCLESELLYVSLVDWYSALGYRVARRLWMGQKTLN